MADKLVRDENDGGVIRRDVDMGDGTYAERAVLAVAEPEFYANRQFRTFLEFSTANGNTIPTGQRILIRATLNVNTILTLANIELDAGSVRVRSFAGGTPTGVFSAMPVVRANAMSTAPAYTAVDTYEATAPGLAATVNITGGVLGDVVRVKTANQNVSTSSVSVNGGASVRGLPVGVVYILIESFGTDPAEGVIRFRWMEMP